MIVNERDHHFARRSSSACAKYAEAFFRISSGAFQLEVLTFELLQALALIGRQARALAGVALRLARRAHRRKTSAA
jgi:hypothetical protein